MEYMKGAFENWIRVTPRSNGTSYSKETISGYISSLKTHAAKLSDLTLDSTDLFTYDSIEGFDRAYAQIKGSAYFDEINKSYHRIFSSALQIYRKFLQSNSLHEEDYML